MKFEMQAEPVLHTYGILTEESDIRAHVSVVNKSIYVFETCKGIEAVNTKTHNDLVSAYQPGVAGATAKGWPIPIDQIDGLIRVDMHDFGFPCFGQYKMSTSEKGAMAVSCVCVALRSGKFPFWVDSEESSDASIQIAGTDVVLAFKKRIQVKCDWGSGERPNGTGNVFLQFSERNPLKQK
jgi:hypothetical protein